MVDDLELKAEIVSKFIKEVGFPVLMCLCMLYLCFVTIQENTAAIDNLASVIAGM